MKRSIHFIELALTVVSLMSTAVCQGVTPSNKLSGSVFDAKTLQPLAGATLFIVGTKIGTTTDIGGDFSIGSIPLDSLTIEISHVGYARMKIPVTFKSDRTDIYVVAPMSEAPIYFYKEMRTPPRNWKEITTRLYGIFLPDSLIRDKRVFGVDSPMAVYTSRDMYVEFSFAGGMGPLAWIDYSHMPQFRQWKETLGCHEALFVSCLDTNSNENHGFKYVIAAKYNVESFRMWARFNDISGQEDALAILRSVEFP